MNQLDETDDSPTYPTIYVQVEHRPAALPPAVCPQESNGPVPSIGPTGNQVATVKLLCPDGQVITQAWTLGTSAGWLKERLARWLDLPVGVLQLLVRHTSCSPIDDQLTLGQLGAKVNDTLELLLSSVHPEMYPIRIKHKALLPMPDVITVHVRDKNGRHKDVVVEIENRSTRQPFLGGFRWKSNGVQFYHAQTQTDYSVGPDNKVRIVKTDGIATNDCQTATIGNNYTQTSSSVSCQVRALDWNVESRDDLVQNDPRPRRFVTVVDAHKAATIIQRRFRGWLSQKNKQQSMNSETTIEEDVEVPLPVESLVIRFGDVTIQKRCLADGQRLSLEEEQQLIWWQELDQLHAAKSSATKDRLLRRLLHRVSQPKVWKASTGVRVQVDTVETEKFRHMRLMYEAVCCSSLTEERIIAIGLLKKTLWGKSGSIVRELMQLADRELDLLNRGLMTSSLSGLQSRLRAVLRNFIISQFPIQISHF